MASSNPPPDLPLGRRVDYPRGYDAALLYPIARALGRHEIGIDPAALPFVGLDRWHAYELGWLDARGKPRVATATLEVPADSPNLVESKSLKIYLNSFNASRFDDDEAVRARIADDLTHSAGAAVDVAFGLPPVAPLATPPDAPRPRAESLDDVDIDIDHYGPPSARFIVLEDGGAGTVVEETLASDLLKSNCPVTGQPDWARVVIGYRGARLDRTGLLRYLVSYRDHCGFHEQCVERIFKDLLDRARPAALSVEARYTRRGGLDINPWRATPGWPRAPASRDPRQ